MNLVLGKVEEVKTVLAEGQEIAIFDGIAAPEKVKRTMDMVFVRGDNIICASPLK